MTVEVGLGVIVKVADGVGVKVGDGVCVGGIGVLVSVGTEIVAGAEHPVSKNMMSRERKVFFMLPSE